MRYPDANDTERLSYFVHSNATCLAIGSRCCHLNTYLHGQLQHAGTAETWTEADSNGLYVCSWRDGFIVRLCCPGHEGNAAGRAIHLLRLNSDRLSTFGNTPLNALQGAVVQAARRASQIGEAGTALVRSLSAALSGPSQEESRQSMPGCFFWHT